MYNGKFYIDVIEEPESNGTRWGICLGEPNPSDEYYIEMPSKEKAFEVKEKLNNYLDECQI